MKNLRASTQHRLFDKTSFRWDNYDRKQNPLYLNMVQRAMNELLLIRGYVSLNEVLHFIGLEPSIRGGQAGWIRDVDPTEGDGYIDFGIWAEGFARGKDWLHGDLDVIMLYFNVDRVAISMPRRIKKLREEGRL